MYCHLRPPDAMAFQLNIFWGFISALQTNSKPFHLQSLWSATFMPVGLRYVMPIN